MCAPGPPVSHHLTPSLILAITTRQGMLDSRTRSLEPPSPLAGRLPGVDRRSSMSGSPHGRIDSALTPHQRCPAPGPALLPTSVSSPGGGRRAIRLAGPSCPGPRALRRRWSLCKIIDSLPCQSHVAAPFNLYFLFVRFTGKPACCPTCRRAAKLSVTRPASSVTSSFCALCYVPRPTLTSTLAP